jgi:hypothetical protein
MNDTNVARFYEELATQYARLFRDDPEYSLAASHYTPEQLAQKMTLGLENGTANKDGSGIKSTCKTLGIAYTYKAIKQFLGETK